MMYSADVSGARVFPTTAGAFFQPLFLNYDAVNGTTVKKPLPEFRDPASTPQIALAPRNTLNDLYQSNTNAIGAVPRNGMTNIMFTVAVNDGTDGETVNVRVIRWYAVRLPRSDRAENDSPDFYIPVASVYQFTIGETASASFNPTPLAGTNEMDFADEVVATYGPSSPDAVLYSPSNSAVALVIMDMHGADAVSFDVYDGTATGDVQVFYAME